MEFFVNKFLVYLPVLFYALVFILSLLFYFFRNKFLAKFTLAAKFLSLVLTVIFFRLIYAILLTGTQYYVWSRQEFTKLLLPPNQSIKYFIQYSFTHFWIGTLISIAAAAVFFLFLKALRKYKERFFDREEILFGFLMALIVGWPNFIVFVLATFIFMVLTSLLRVLIFKSAYTNLYSSLILASLTVSVFGDKLVDIFRLTVLRI